MLASSVEVSAISSSACITRNRELWINLSDVGTPMYV